MISGQRRPTSFHTRHTRRDMGCGPLCRRRMRVIVVQDLASSPTSPSSRLLASFLRSFLPLLPFSARRLRLVTAAATPRGARRLIAAGHRPLFHEPNGKRPTPPGGESESAGCSQVLGHRPATDPFTHVPQPQRVSAEWKRSENRPRRSRPGRKFPQGSSQCGGPPSLASSAVANSNRRFSSKIDKTALHCPSRVLPMSCQRKFPRNEKRKKNRANKHRRRPLVELNAR